MRCLLTVLVVEGSPASFNFRDSLEVLEGGNAKVKAVSCKEVDLCDEFEFGAFFGGLPVLRPHSDHIQLLKEVVCCKEARVNLARILPHGLHISHYERLNQLQQHMR